MYIEDKSPTADQKFRGRIGLVTFTKTGKSVKYSGRLFLRAVGGGIGGNYFDSETHSEFWISGCKKSGGDTLFGGIVEIDDDIRERYWKEIRNEPDRINETQFRG
jgi:hypothetical protein